MTRKCFVGIVLSALLIPAGSMAHSERTSLLDVHVVSDRGSEFGRYRTYPRICQDGKYFYVEALKGERYAIRVTNRSNRRVGVVIAVDGRNIISGQKSDLKPSERMYIIGPREENTFEGWRTGMDRTNRFYFTTPSDSYAERVFADASAMGTIALAVYRENLPEIIPYPKRSLRMEKGLDGAASRASKEHRSIDREGAKESEQAGTGFGETTYSPARVVHFEPERTPAERIVLKYEWRSELCKKGIIRCIPENRFWPDGQEFAPIPEDFRG